MAAGWLRDGPERAAAEGRVLLELRAILGDECPGRHRGGARDDALELPVPGDAARVVVDDLPERRPHRQLVGPRTDDVAGDAEELRAGALLGTDRAEPVGAAQHDVRHASERLDVVD